MKISTVVIRFFSGGAGKYKCTGHKGSHVAFCVCRFGHPTTATDGGGVTAVRASHREQLLASLIDSDPALSAASSRPQSRGASRVPSQSATPRTSLSSSSFTHPGANP